MKRRSFIELAFTSFNSLALANLFFSDFFKPRNSQINELQPLLVDENGMPIEKVKQWEKKKAELLQKWGNYLGLIRPNPNPPVISLISEDRVDGLTRQLIEYEGEPGKKTRAYILTPPNVKRRRAAIVALHATVDNPLDVMVGKLSSPDSLPFGVKFAKQGFITICPICFLWDNTEGREYAQQTHYVLEGHPGSKGMAKMLFDAQRAIDVLYTIKKVKTAQIGIAGHSLGAKTVLYLGAFDSRVKAAVFNEGGIGINFTNWHDIWYLGPEIHSKGYENHEVLALMAPRPFLLIAGNSADGEKSKPFVDAVEPVYKLYKKKENVKFMNHMSGHSVNELAEQWTYDWLTTKLKK